MSGISMFAGRTCGRKVWKVAAMFAVTLFSAGIVYGASVTRVKESDYRSDPRGILRITNMTSFDVAIFAGKVEKGNFIGAIKAKGARNFDIGKLANVPQKGAFLYRAVPVQSLNTKAKGGITSEDVVYTGLVTYDLTRPDRKIDSDIFANVDDTQNTFIYVSNLTKYIVQLRVDSPTGEKVGMLSPGERNKKLWIRPQEDGLPYRFFPTFVIRPVNPDTIVPVGLRRALSSAIIEQRTSFDYENETGESVHYLLSGVDGQWALKTEQSTHLVDVFGRPSAAHWLGTDGAGMDVVVRLMYGGRVSLLIGFAVIVIEVLLGVLLGGVAGYFGGIGDALLMRLVDIINCIPALPLYLIIGAFMDGANVDVHKRIYVLMLVMGFMSWPSVARVVRGQILSLREQEFMIAAEALGLSVFHRIFRHLVPNVIPQLIVLATMGLGNVILVESTLSFLGLGISFPLASWGNILNSVNDVFVMTNYFSVWIPAGFCILATVLAFNFIGDGLRDAFDPKMRR